MCSVHYAEPYEDRHIWIAIYLDHHFWVEMRSMTNGFLTHLYTHEKFKEVQGQFKGKVNCITRSMHSTLGFTTYEVVEQGSNSTFNKFFITYDAVSREVNCQCLLFESRGILCHHSLSVLSFEQVDNMAPKYIEERWSMNIKRRHTHQEQLRQASTRVEKQEFRRFGVLVAQYIRICFRVRGADRNSTSGV
ncbi:hypothetical protein Ahy_B06g084423 isoform B [Arachis hypogaea]|uniref:Protein FAR1-RELATED SEQUENCE n=1 Tax=Arachis hypogaea TaxID=3818 RepID=A0A444YRU7_ARAHY|nr:hypothetical protein Ahy_B06g084423 isoform B [Arachis hypogaea]